MIPYSYQTPLPCVDLTLHLMTLSLLTSFMYLTMVSRNYEIVKKYEKLIQSGKQIVILPNTIKEKDLNDMIMSGHNVQRVVDSNIYSGLEATIKLNAWKKV